jgi:hypothetical protein
MARVLIGENLKVITPISLGPQPLPTEIEVRMVKRLTLRIGLCTLLILFSFTACVENEPYYQQIYQPIYMSWEELRLPVEATPPRELESLGKIYAWGTWLFINQPNMGIHVIDNNDPTKPINSAWLPIPGNIDIAVKDSKLFVDSYVDLVVLDLSDLTAISEVARLNDTFVYDSYQNVDESVWFDEGIDETRGVVIGAIQVQKVETYE